MAVKLIELRQPRPNDLIAETFVVAGFASGFEGVVLWRVLDDEGATLGDGNIKGAGSMGVARHFADTLSINGPGERGKRVTLQVFGEDASGEHPPGTDLNQVPLTLFSDLDGFTLHEVVPGDNLTRIAAEVGFGGSTADDVFAANRDQLSQPNLIFPGQVLRVPVFEP
jgi:nucleoid-associated protein YgaU